MKLNKNQRKQLADIFGNTSVAWFSAGVIAPFFIPMADTTKLLSGFIVGFTLSVFYAIVSLLFLNK